MNSESNFSANTDWQKRIGLGVLTLGVALTAMLVLKKVPQPKVAAETPQVKPEVKQTTSPASLPKSLQTTNLPSTSSDYSSRVVAYVEVTAAEVENSLSEDLKGLNVDRKTFVDKVLKNYRKNLYEWKEDVIRPKLMLSKLVRSRVKVTDEDIKKAFDAYYGEKVECRIVMFEKGYERAVLNDYPKLRDSEEEFHKAAKNQKSSSLAATAGKIRPIARNTTGNEELEKAAFALQPNEVSPVIGTPEGLIVVKCDKRIPADTTVNLESVREKITAEIIEKKITAEIPVVFAEMRKRANPKLILQGVNQMDDLTKTIAPLIKEVDDALKAVSGGK